MQIDFENKQLERVLIGVNAAASAMVAATFVLLFGFDTPLFSASILYSAQLFLLFVFITEKIFRCINCTSKKQFLRNYWFEIPFLIALLVTAIGAGRWFATDADKASNVRHFAIGIYLIFQVVIKLCRTSVNLAATGKNPTQTLIASFVVLILSGAGLLILPAANANGQNISFVDALFTSTSAACVTGLVVKDTGTDFSLMGQIVIITLIQLGGLGIVIFGAVLALLLGQAFSLRESAAMQDLLSARTLSKIGNMIAFIFVGTILVEALGAIGLYGMWKNIPGGSGPFNQWFCSIFHSISAFCNAGFGLFDSNLIDYNRNWQVYLIICPLIIIGGLGFTVLYDLAGIITERTGRLLKKIFSKQYRFSMEAPKRIRFQTIVVLATSAKLIIFGALAIFIFEKYASSNESGNNANIFDALFQSITARTAGFNTVDISALTPSSKFILILLMFVGGSPGSTAGGIKTVTLAIIIMAAIATLRKRGDVEMFKRSVRLIVVGRAITVTLLFAAVLFTTTLALSITEHENGFSFSDIIFESGSALGTVGLSTGITPSLTTAGKLIIIIVMLIGRLGPLTLLAALTFNLKPAKYNYPEEALIVG
jgi:trk system potassium uptake protein TrkH